MNTKVRVVAYLAAWACLTGGVAAQNELERPLLPGTRAAGDPAEVGREVPRRVLFEMRLAENEPVRGLTLEARVKDSNQPIHLHYQVLLTNGDIQKANAVDGRGASQVAIHLSSDAAMKLATATARHRGRPIAVILDGEVVAVLTVQNPMQADVLFGRFVPADATRIARALERW